MNSRKRLHRARVLSLLVTVVLFGFAETGTGTNDVILVTAKPWVTTRSRTPGTVGIVRGAAIAEQMPGDTVSAMVSVPGVSRIADGAWGGDVNIRGLSRDSVVLLIDGARVNTATDINARFGLVDAFEIERIEVLKGPVSSLYGSGSLGGVVNIVTRGGRWSDRPEWRGGVSLNVGDNPDGFGVSAYAARNTPRHFVYVSQSFRGFDDFEDGNGDRVENTQGRTHQSRGRAGIKVSDRVACIVDMQLFEGEEIGIPGTGTAPLPPAAAVTYPTVRRSLGSLQLRYSAPWDILRESRLLVYMQTIDRRARIDQFPPPAAAERVRPRADHDTSGIKWIGTCVFASHVLAGGIDIWQRDLDSSRVREFRDGRTVRDIPLPDSSSRSSGVFVEDDWHLGYRVTVNAGVRYDRIDVENEPTSNWDAGELDDASWNGHVGISWSPTPPLVLKALAARGYRAPSLEERYQFLSLAGGVTKFGDPDLEPEESVFGEVRAEWTAETLHLAVGAFVNELDNLISDRLVDATTLVNANVSEARLHGFEAECRWRPADAFEVYGNLAHTLGRDTGNDSNLPEIPPLNGRAGVRCDTWRGLWVQVESVFADRQDAVAEDERETAGWHRCDLRIGFDRETEHGAQRFFIGVDNLFDKAYRDHLSSVRQVVYNEPGRALRLGCDLSF